jgi:hypothetical protein
MKRIINQLGIVNYNPVYNTVEIHFKNNAEVSIYKDTLQVATQMGELYKTSRWLLCKTDFQDLTTSDFYNLVSEWQAIINNNFQKIALFTNRRYYNDFQSLAEASPGYSIRFFKNIKEAQLFLALPSWREYIQVKM